MEGLSKSARNANTLPTLKASGAQIVAEAMAHAGGRQADDVCLLLARRKCAGGA